jgi:hypothetical protein
MWERRMAPSVDELPVEEWILPSTKRRPATKGMVLSSPLLDE